MHERGYGSSVVEREYPNCEARELHDPRADGELVRGSRCRECGEWYTVFDHRDQSRTPT